MRRSVRLIGATLLAGALLSGCGSDAQDSGGSAPAAGPALGGADRDAAPEAAPGAGKDTAAEAPDLSVDQRSIIYRGSITVRVKDVGAAAAQAIGVASTAGGFVGDDQRHSGSGADNASLTLRVPADKFSGVVDQLAGLGDEENRAISTEDVTEQTVDLDARITVQQARVDSGRKLLSQAKSLSDLVMLEREVATRESDLASLQGKKRRLADLTALSTITVTLLDPEAAVDRDNESPGFLTGLAGGWRALVASLGVLLTVLGALLPWLIVIGLPVWGIIWAFRRYRRRRPSAPAFAGAAPPAFLLAPGRGASHGGGHPGSDPPERSGDEAAAPDGPEA